MRQDLNIEAINPIVGSGGSNGSTNSGRIKSQPAIVVLCRDRRLELASQRAFFAWKKPPEVIKRAG
ncbi:hypothetical protein ACQ4M3_14040 [Leptolyngbya sp. AN03gr2]|uniref:hypothetical protein n=1 Tax=unclassified Leptolyngbya TaxID=2650499 RepID=UPI003D32319B